MTDDEFLSALERCTLAESEFGHASHVRAAYLYLQLGDFAIALQRLRDAISRFATHAGKPGRYHETVTVAYLALIQQHIAERGRGGSWERFALDNPELFDCKLLLQYYSQGQLDSDLARRQFLLPHRTPRTEIPSAV